jgi:putative protease
VCSAASSRTERARRTAATLARSIAWRCATRTAALIRSTADVGCRNTVFGAKAQEASEHLQTWRDAGIEHYRLEFVHETAGQLTGVAQAFADAHHRKLDQAELRNQLKRISAQGITEGSLFVPGNYLEVPTLA